MRRKLEKYWKFSIAFLAITLAFPSFSQDTSSTYRIQYPDFDEDIVPAQIIYGNSWDPDHVDSPAYNAEHMSWGFLIMLADSNSPYYHPIQGRVTSKYGWRKSRWHKGIDISLDIGDPVCAAFDGVVRMQRYNAGGFGNYIVIRHENGLETLYAHLSEAIVERNQIVSAGDTIGFGGSTGRSTGPHLHFEVRIMGQAFDPARIIDFTNYTLAVPKVYINHTWFPYIKYKVLQSSDQEYSGATNTGKPIVVSIPQKKYHKVKKGDTLYAISKKYNIPVNTLCKLNKMTRNSPLPIGKNLRIK
ncbi:MAG TPA: peptidase M23 [Bacteroidetes bacterium]|jgi:murein DD-endopeptidase MepM/ murein hydrolase activator NlpD|nr:peptidase M23 [Bacteroidota bacterium]